MEQVLRKHLKAISQSTDNTKIHRNKTHFDGCGWEQNDSSKKKKSSY